MAKANIINKLVLQLGDKEVELTMPQAKELHAALNELFNKEPEVQRDHYYYYPTRPLHVGPYWNPYHDTIWCSSSGNVIGTLTTNTTSGTTLALDCKP